MNKDLIINELQVNVAAFVINESKDTFKSEEQFWIKGYPE
jgi:hypothetical protein